MRSYRLLTVSLAVLALAHPPHLSAQAAEGPAAPRSGAWLGLGVGLGSSSLSCQICVSDRRSGTSAMLKAGFTLSPSIRLGAEAAGWARFDDVDQLLWTLTPAAYFYPSPRRGLFLKAGPSVSFFSARDDDTEVGTTSFGLQLGVGYEFPVSTSAQLAPYLDFTATSFGSLTSGEQEITGGAGVTLIHLGVGVTFNE